MAYSKLTKDRTQAVVPSFSIARSLYDVVKKRADEEQRPINSMLRYIVAQWAQAITKQCEKN